MSDIDKAVQELAERIAGRCESEVHNCEPADVPPLLGVVLIEIEPISRVLKAAEEAVRPSYHSISRDVENDYRERREALRKALAGLQENKGERE